MVLTSIFKKQLKKIRKRSQKIEKLTNLVNLLQKGEKLEEKYKDYVLNDTKKYKYCRECHIEPDWLLIYKKIDKELILVLIETGSHSDLFQ